ncbi:MAG: hypothetical protein OHK0039_45590 [Bacteroidia bacterium]
MSASVFDAPDDPNQWYLSSAHEIALTTINSSQQEEALLSYFGRINYSYDDRYLLQVNARFDGSSRFTAENRWGFFPAFSAGWNIAEESFMQNVPQVNTLKLCGSWGWVGNQNSVSNYNFVVTVDPSMLYVLNNEIVQGFIPTRLANPDLVWETTTSTNIGIDAGFFQDRRLFTADYFVKTTTDMIVDGQLPRFAGAYPARINAGSMQNNGLELSLIYRNQVGEFAYDLSANATLITNEVVDLADVPFYAGGSVGRIGNTTRTEVGYEIAYFYGLESDGLFNNQEEVDSYVGSDGTRIQPQAKPGDIKFVDQNADGVIDDEDRIYLGSGTPAFSYGFSAGASFKGFDLRIFLQGTFGNEIVNGMWGAFHEPLGFNNATRDRLDRWTPTNTETNEPRMFITSADNLRFSDYYVEDGSYLRVRNVTLGYTLPAALLPANARIRVYAASDNLLTFTKYSGWDPEIGELYYNPFWYGVDQATYPQPRRFRAGIDVKF